MRKILASLTMMTLATAALAAPAPQSFISKDRGNGVTKAECAANRYGTKAPNRAACYKNCEAYSNTPGCRSWCDSNCSK